MKNFNLTPRAQKLVKEAYEIASEHKHVKITYLHLFIAFFSSKKNQIEEAFLYFNLNCETLKKDALTFLLSHYQVSKTSAKPSLSNECKQLFIQCKHLSEKFDQKYIGLEHVFISLFESPDRIFKSFIDKLDFSFEKVIDFFEQKIGEEDIPSMSNDDIFGNPPIQSENQNSLEYLNKYAINLNTQVANGKIHSLYENKILLQKISEVLCRKNKNNPLIVGEAGVGKTALVESLAKSIYENRCSDFIALKQIYSLDIPMMVAGCKYRGEFEEKIKNLLGEIANNPNIIIFIDEIHTIIGAGNPENGMDVANILKPYLARGEISCIGATTNDEYKKTIADDPALSRRFQIIKIEEPNKDQVIELLKNIKSSYEEYHVIKFEDDILQYIVDVSDRYLEGRFPDKSIDILDQVGSKLKLKNFSKTTEMIKVENQMRAFIDKNISKNPQELNTHVCRFLSKLKLATEKMVKKWKKNPYIITKLDILNVISDKTALPIEALKSDEGEKIKQVKKALTEKVIGQDEQIQQIYKSLVRAKAGFRSSSKPICSYLFAGPTGTGKTMTAKIIANELFINKNNFVFIDMSEYTDKTAVNKLIGSSPGYIGYEKGGFLTEKVKKNPYSLILFDEIQKADEDVLYMLLQILDEGKITDSSGKVVNFTNCVIIMTTNVGFQTQTESIGFNKTPLNPKFDSLSRVRKFFPPDLLNRIDEIILFNNLNEVELKKIIKINIDSIQNDISDKCVSIKYDESLIDFVFNKIQFDNFGARQVIKTIQREIQTLIAEKLLEYPELNEVSLSIRQNNIQIE